MKKIFCITMTALLVLAACGGSNDEAESAENSDGLSSGEQAIADALTAELVSDPEFPFGDDAICISETSVSVIGNYPRKFKRPSPMQSLIVLVHPD